MMRIRRFLKEYHSRVFKIFTLFRAPKLTVEDRVHRWSAGHLGLIFRVEKHLSIHVRRRHEEWRSEEARCH